MERSSKLSIVFLKSLADQINSEIELLESDKPDSGHEYNLAMLYAQAIRAKRRKSYGDSFLNDTDEFLLHQLQNKLDRIALNIGEQAGEESVIDSAADVINYAAFILAKRLSNG